MEGKFSVNHHQEKYIQEEVDYLADCCLCYPRGYVRHLLSLYVSKAYTPYSHVTTGPYNEQTATLSY